MSNTTAVKDVYVEVIANKLRLDMERIIHGEGKLLALEVSRASPGSREIIWKALFDKEGAALKVHYAWRSQKDIRLLETTKGWYVAKV